MLHRGGDLHVVGAVALEPPDESSAGRAVVDGAAWPRKASMCIGGPIRSFWGTGVYSPVNLDSVEPKRSQLSPAQDLAARH